MKSYLSISLKYLYNQKKRTILTILGVIMATALFAGIFTIMTSMHHSMLLSETKTNGDYHVEIENINFKQYIEIDNYKDTEKTAIKENFGMVSSPSSSLTFNHLGYSKNMFDIFYYDIIEGNAPNKENEILLPDWTKDFFKNNITAGDTIKIEDKNYIISGFYSPTYYEYGQEGAEVISFLSFEHIQNSDDLTTYIKSKKPFRVEMYTSSLLENEIIFENENEISYNTSVLKYYGNSLNLHLDKSIYIIISILIFIIIFAAIAVIYNSFHISLLERIKQFGILRAIGASEKQISRIVLIEALIISLIGIPIGLISGIFAIKVLLNVINNIAGDMFSILVFSFSYEIIIAGSILGFISTMLSAIGPAYRAKKISPIRAIRNTDNIKKSKQKIKFKFLRKALPINIILASNNLKRNKKRYRITVFSIAISITLFILFTSFSNMFTTSEVYSHKEMGDFYIYSTSNNKIDEKIIEKISNIEGVEAMYKNQTFSTTALIPKEKANPKLLDYIDSNDKEKIELSSLIIKSYGNDFLTNNANNLIKGSINLSEMKNSTDAIVYSKTKHYDIDGVRHLFRNFDFDINDKIYTQENTTFNISGVLDNGQFDHLYTPLNSAVLFVSEETFNKLYPNIAPYSIYLIVNEDKASVVDKSLSEITKENKTLRYINYHQMAKDNNNMNTVINIFLYGFIAVISLISCLNIINTLCTNIILRKKELSILKAIGMSTSKIRNLIFTEGFLYSLSAAIYGSIAGTILSYLFYRVTTTITQYPFDMPYKEIAIAFSAALLISTISSYIPLKRINNSNLIKNLSQD